MRERAINFIFLFCILSFTFLSSQEKIIKDSLGTSFSLLNPPQRIISLAPNITEILFSLGLGEKIVGLTEYCDYPAETSTKEKIGGMVDPNLEKIKSLNPDLVIGFRGNPIRFLERLKSLHVPVFALEIGKDLESVFSLIKIIGKITYKEKEAEELIASMNEKYLKIKAILRSAKHKPKVFLSLHGMGLWTCGKESFLHDLLTKAKGINIAGTVPRKWLNFNREQLIHEDPEVIIILAKSKGDFAKAREWLGEHSHLEKVTALRENHIFFLDENLATRPGPRLIDALAQLARILHPELFSQKP